MQSTADGLIRVVSLTYSKSRSQIPSRRQDNTTTPSTKFAPGTVRSVIAGSPPRKMAAATTIADAFGESADLYTDVLGLPESGPSVPKAHIRRAYYRAALKYHPDKQRGGGGKEEDAKLKFQAVSVAYSVLSDEGRRAEYDETGELCDDADEDGFGDGKEKTGTDRWAEYFSGIFGKVTVSDIDAFAAKYRCSDEEEKDVLRYYVQFKGDLAKMVECVMLSREEDGPRWIEDYIRPAVGRGDVEDFLAGITGGTKSAPAAPEEMSEDDEETETEESEDDIKEKPVMGMAAKGKKPPAKKKVKAKANTKSTTTRKRKGGSEGGVDADLIAAIRGNAVARSKSSFDSLLVGLENRYAGGGGGGGGKKKKRKQKSPPDDIPDDEFERIRAGLGKK